MYHVFSIESKSIIRTFIDKESFYEYLMGTGILSICGHNANDTLVSRWYCDENGTIRKSVLTYVSYILYEDDKVMDIPTLKKEVEIFSYEYQEKREKYHKSNPLWWKWIGRKVNFRYRFDPVPYVRKSHTYGNYYRKIKRGKSEYTKRVADRDIIHDSKVSVKKELVTSWGDDYPRSFSKSWKDQSKKRKQWR